MKTALRALALLALAAALAVLVLPLGRRAEVALPRSWRGRAAFSKAGAGPLFAGAAKVRLELAAGVALAGYPGWRHAEGPGDALFARALVLESGGLRVTLVALETLLVSADLEEEVFRRAGLPEDACALIAASHTHSGPGGTWDSAVAGLIGSGWFDRRVQGEVVRAAAEAIVLATRALRPAALGAVQLRSADGFALARARSGEAVDSSFTELRVADPAGHPLATAVVYAMHPTVLGRSRRLSGDWPGEAARFMEEGGGVALIFQGAVGNTTWPREGREDSLAAVARLAGSVANQARAAAPMALRSTVQLSCSARLTALPPPQASAAVPWILRQAATNALALADPELAVQLEVGLGEVTLRGVPGEPSASARAPLGAQVVGLADGYVGYVESKEIIEQGTGEAGKSYFGPGLAKALGLDGR